jgi:hypothetical protein
MTAALAAAAMLMSAPAASAAITGPSATWTGGAGGSSGALWSDHGANAANWSGNTVPGTSIGLLSFPDLGPNCDSATPATTCYTGTDDLGPINVQQIQLGGGSYYRLFPTSFDNPADTITLSGDSPGAATNVGLTATTVQSNNQLTNFGIPLILSSPQQWDVGGNGILYLNTISGSPLTLDLNHGYVQANDVETSAVTVSGPGSLQLDQATGSAEKLPAVTLNDADGTQSGLAVASTGASSGPITLAGTDNNFIVLTDKAPGETRLQVNGNVTLDGSSNVEFDIDGNTSTPGVDSSQLTTSGTVAFNGAQISLWQAEDSGKCDTLRPGTSYTLLQAGRLTGQIKVGGKLISAGQTATEAFQSNSCTGAPNTRVVIKYGSNALTATIASGSAGSGSTGSTPTITPVLRAKLRADLRRLAHPHGRRALRRLLRLHLYRTHFRTPAAGKLSVVWRATIKTGHGRHARRHTYVVARGVAHAGGPSRVRLTIRLTARGLRLLRAHPFSLRVSASERFVVFGGGTSSLVRRFTI